jgi:hypothetical protein
MIYGISKGHVTWKAFWSNWAINIDSVPFEQSILVGYHNTYDWSFLIFFYDGGCYFFHNFSTTSFMIVQCWDFARMLWQASASSRVWSEEPPIHLRRWLANLRATTEDGIEAERSWERTSYRLHLRAPLPDKLPRCAPLLRSNALRHQLAFFHLS